MVLDGDTERSLQRARSGGVALDSDLSAALGATMGADVSGVRVHAGRESDSLNEQMGARAFTIGRDVFFGGGVPDAGTASGLGLIAHEVAHTVQQGESSVRRAVEAPGVDPPAQARSAPPKLKGSIGEVDEEPEPEVTMGRLPAQEDTRGHTSWASSGRRSGGSGRAPAGSVPVVARFATTTRIRRNDRVVGSPGARDEAVGRSVTYGSQVSGSYAASAFGAMSPAASFKDISELLDGKVQIDAKLNATFDWGVKSGGNIDVPKPDAPVVTEKNYQEVAADLAPKLEGKSWRARRQKYWSASLTSRHELFHANDADGWFAREGPGIARAYLTRNPIDLTDDERKDAGVVKAKVEEALKQAISAMYQQFTTYMTADLGKSGYLDFPAEERAFGDGKQPYQELADGVKAHGEKLVEANSWGSWFSKGIDSLAKAFS